MVNPEPQPKTITQEDTQQKIIEITSHPTLPNYKVIVINGKVRHELMFNPDASIEEIINDVVVYLVEYESIYPLGDPEVWDELVSLMQQGEIQ